MWTRTYVARKITWEDNYSQNTWVYLTAQTSKRTQIRRMLKTPGRVLAISFFFITLSFPWRYCHSTTQQHKLWYNTYICISSTDIIDLPFSTPAIAPPRTLHTGIPAMFMVQAAFHITSISTGSLPPPPFSFMGALALDFFQRRFLETT
jgi:hypothetical protein